MPKYKPINPRKSEADKLSAMVWSRSVKIASGGMAWPKLEVQFMPECIQRSGGELIRPRLMDRYSNGKLTPKRGGQKCGGLDLVFRIESQFNGTARWLLHPLWDLMQPKYILLADLHRHMLLLNGLFIGKFFSNNDDDGTRVRNYFAEPADIKAISNTEKTLDAFAFLLGILREAEIRADMQNHYCARDGMLKLFPNIAALPPIEPVAGRLFDYIESSYFNVIYIIPPNGDEMIFPKGWREIYPHLARLYPTPDTSDINDRERRYILKPI